MIRFHTHVFALATESVLIRHPSLVRNRFLVKFWANPCLLRANAPLLLVAHPLLLNTSDMLLTPLSRISVSSLGWWIRLWIVN